MDNEFWKDVFKYVPSKLIPAITGFLSLIIFTRFLSPEDFGLYNLIITTNRFLLIIFVGWLSRSMLRYYKFYTSENLKEEFISYIFFLNFLIGIFVSLLYLIIYNLDIIIINKRFSDLMLLGIWLILTKGFVDLILNINRASRNSKKYSIYQLFYSIGKIILVLILFKLTDLKVEAILLSYLLVEIFIVILEITSSKSFISFKVLKFKKIKQLSNKFFYKIYNYGFSVAGISIFSIILSAGDKYLIQYFLGEYEVGIYSASYRIGEMSIHSIFMILMLAAFPIIINKYEEEGEKNASRAITKFLRYYFIILTPALFGIIILSKEITFIILGENFYSSFYILPLTSLGTYFHGLTLYINKPFELKERTKDLLFITIFSAILNIILNIIFINIYGIVGAAYSTIFSYIVYLYISFIKSKKIIKLKIPFVSLLKSLLASIIMVLTIMILKQFIIINNLFIIIVYVVFGVLVYFISIYLLKEKEVIKLIEDKF